MKQRTSKQTPPTSHRHLMSLDLGDRYSRYFVLDEGGLRVEEGSVPTTLDGMRQLFLRLTPLEVVMETGGHSPWISRLAETMGYPTLVANSRKLALITRNERKNDRTDAELLGRLARADRKLLRAVRHRSEQSQVDLTLMRSRAQLVDARTALVNHVRGQLKSFGYRLGTCSANCFHERALRNMPKQLETALLPVLNVIGQLTSTIRSLEGKIEQVLEERYPAGQRLQQIAGVGPLTTLCFILTLDDPGRMKDSRQVGPYLGLTPRTRDSGDSSPQLHISKSGDNELRRLLVICANYILGRFGPDCDLRRFGMKIAERGGKNARKRAKVAVARKLAVLMHRLWKTGETYDPLHLAKLRNEAVPA